MYKFVIKVFDYDGEMDEDNIIFSSDRKYNIQDAALYIYHILMSDDVQSTEKYTYQNIEARLQHALRNNQPSFTIGFLVGNENWTLQCDIEFEMESPYSYLIDPNKPSCIRIIENLTYDQTISTILALATPYYYGGCEDVIQLYLKSIFKEAIDSNTSILHFDGVSRNIECRCNGENNFTILYRINESYYLWTDDNLYDIARWLSSHCGISPTLITENILTAINNKKESITIGCNPCRKTYKQATVHINREKFKIYYGLLDRDE